MKIGWLEFRLWPPLLWIKSHRIHHFWPGLVLILAGYPRAGLIIIVHDLHDWRVWVKDLLRTSAPTGTGKDHK